MKVMNRLKQIFLAVLIAGLVGCTAGGGIGGTGMSYGTIDSFGSVFVNGVEFDTSSTVITVDDQPATQSDLRLGMVVRVDGDIAMNGTDGEAVGLSYDNNLEGPIRIVQQDPVNPSRKNFTLLGVIVYVDKTITTFDGTASFASLAQDNFVEVSGFYDANGDLQATYLKGVSTTFIANSTLVEARGVVAAYNGSTQFTLKISADRSLTVNVTGGTSIVDWPAGKIVEGQFAEVEGTIPSASSLVLTATRIEYEDIEDDIDEIEVEGFVTEYVSNSEFKVSGIAVDASNAEFEPASLATNLGDNIKVEVEGTRVNGTLIAEAVKQRGGDLRFEGSVGMVTAGSNLLTLSYVPGEITVHLNNATLLEDEVSGVDPFTLADIGSGDALRVQAYLDGSGNVVASQVRRVPVDNDVIRARIECSGACTSVTVFGITFGTDGATTFEDAANNPISSADFYTNVNDGDLIKIQDDDVPDGMADKVQIE